MKKRNLFCITALLAVLLVMGTGLAGCDNGTTSGDGTEGAPQIIYRGISTALGNTYHLYKLCATF